MGIWEHQESFDGKPVQDYEPGQSLDPNTTNYRIRVDYDSDISFADMLTQFVSSPGADAVTGLLTGSFSDEMYDESMAPAIEGVIAAAELLPALTGIFFGDITVEENEISWIQQTDVSPVWQAFPRLRLLQLRGGEGLSLGTIVHDQLQKLIIETGGLPVEVVRQVTNAKLPELTHLELYLGDSGYGATSTLDDIKPLLNPELFPKLRVLGLKNCEFQDAVAEAIVDSPLAAQLEELDCSLGTMTDVGANAIFNKIDRFKSLKTLDVSDNYISNSVCAALSALPLSVNVSEQEEGDEDDRYVSVGE